MIQHRINAATPQTPWVLLKPGQYPAGTVVSVSGTFAGGTASLMMRPVGAGGNGFAVRQAGSDGVASSGPAVTFTANAATSVPATQHEFRVTFTGGSGTEDLLVQFG